MAEQTLVALEFPELIKVLQNFACSSLGRRQLAGLRPGTDLPLIKAQLQEVDELKELNLVEGACPLERCSDLGTILKRMGVPGSLLTPTEFNEVLAVLRLIRRVRQFFRDLADRYPLVAGRALRLQELAELRETIAAAISPHGLILDQASPELHQIRVDMAETRHRLTSQLHKLFLSPGIKEALQDQVISQRNGRYVIPVKADYKGRITGIIHDQSQSKATLFIEPLETVNQNNSLNLLANEEKREEERILRQLTDLLRVHQEAIQHNLIIYGEVDAIQAKALYAEKFQTTTPLLTTSGRISLKEARHPLLLVREMQKGGRQKVMPVSLEMDQQRRFLVLSGANTGGKTVTLKTLGLLCLMLQSGIPIPAAEGSEICLFEQIFADIGDTQDLAHDLSTFSAHIKRVAEMLKQMQGRCLVLLDELGTATDPNEGGALALALLRAFARAGAYGVVTTHYHLIKAFAHEEPGFENVALLFDEHTQRPLYRLAYGIAGPSNALKIAQELGLSPAIIAEAEQYLGQEGMQALQLLSRMEASQQALARQKQELDEERLALTRQEANLTAQRQELEQERRRLWEQDREAVTGAIKQAEAEFKKILGRLHGGQESWGSLRHALTKEQNNLRQLLPEPRPLAQEPAEVFQIGQKVWLSSLGREGVVMSQPDKDGRMEVLVGAVKIKLLQQDIKTAGKGVGGGRVFRGRSRGGVDIQETAPMSSPTLNIIGLRVEEALPLVDRLLDQAVLHGCQQVDIIHGIGTGRLKKAVREHLRHHALVKDVHSGATDHGGAGVTVVDMRD
jgi:DNA mismatch repair protein MutS2